MDEPGAESNQNCGVARVPHHSFPSFSLFSRRELGDKAPISEFKACPEGFYAFTILRETCIDGRQQCLAL